MNHIEARHNKNRKSEPVRNMIGIYEVRLKSRLSASEPVHISFNVQATSHEEALKKADKVLGQLVIESVTCRY